MLKSVELRLSKIKYSGDSIVLKNAAISPMSLIFVMNSNAESVEKHGFDILRRYMIPC